MILYFSATGNCKYVAQKIANALECKYESIQDVKEGVLFDVDGIVAPTYAWGIPSILEDFLYTHIIKKRKPIFFVATYGTSTGQSCYHANVALKKGSDIEFDAYYDVKMPDTWTPIFDLSNKEKVDKINEKVDAQVDRIIDLINNNSKGNFMKSKLPSFTKYVYHPYYNAMRKTSHFSVNDNCVSCGLCEIKCPVKAIQLENGRPTWVKKSCVMCLGCLHRCPKFAIQYGKNTAKHGQYTNPNVRV